MARGNAVMKAKRTTGPSPQTVLITCVRMERCDVKGCNERPLITSTTDGTISRKCKTHIHGVPQKQARIVSRGWRPPWMA